MLFGLESGAGLYEVAITVNYLCENGSLDWQTAMRLDQSFYERVHLLVETGNGLTQEKWARGKAKYA